MAARKGRANAKTGKSEAKTYRHPEAESLLRPDVGVQAQFKKRKPPVKYRYDSSLSPALDWDENPAREAGEALIREILDTDSLEQAKAAASKLRAMSKPFLDWAGKAERAAFEVLTLPLFVHERLSTKAIIETLKGHKIQAELFGDPQHPIADQVLKAYEHRDKWVNRMILGDSLVVMNSLLHYEGLGGQVQMIYIDPPYGVKFGSNFQPFVRKRDVSHNDDEDMTREPEMVKAYRDTWELGLHSYLSYLRDRLLLARELLAPSGSVFVQISDENLHHVRELMDEVFGAGNFSSLVTFAKTTSASGELMSTVGDYLLWYGKDRTSLKSRPLFLERSGEGWVNYDYARLDDGVHRRMLPEEASDWSRLPSGARVYRRDNLTSQRPAQAGDVRSFAFGGRDYRPGKGTFKTDLRGLEKLRDAQRLEAYGETLAYRRFASDFPYRPLSNLWTDTLTGGFVEERHYVVQTLSKIVQRCLLMTTDPGDLVLDPTCGSGTTAYVAEQWGRRWITIDTSRVPLALARQRLLTATFPYYELKEDARGPAGGFVYVRKQNSKGEEVGGIVPHVTLKSIANDEPPDEEVLVDRPEVSGGITRVTGPFCVEATIPTPIDYEAEALTEVRATKTEDTGAEDYGSFIERMIEVLRKSPVLQVLGGNKVKLKNVRPPAKSLTISAEAVAENGGEKPIAIVFGPENGAVSEKLVFEAAREAHAKGHAYLYVIGLRDPAQRPVAHRQG